MPPKERGIRYAHNPHSLSALAKHARLLIASEPLIHTHKVRFYHFGSSNSNSHSLLDPNDAITQLTVLTPFLKIELCSTTPFGAQHVAANAPPPFYIHVMYKRGWCRDDCAPDDTLRLQMDVRGCTIHHQMLLMCPTANYASRSTSVGILREAVVLPMSQRTF